MNILNNPIPFGEYNNFVGKIFKKLFGNDQRNVLFFAIGLGFPAILISFFGMWITAVNIPLKIFSSIMTIFIIWVIYEVNKILKNLKT